MLCCYMVDVVLCSMMLYYPYFSLTFIIVCF